MKGLIDIGANLAQEYFAEPNRAQMQWIFFEPQKAVFDEMCKRLSFPQDNIKVFNMALGNRTGEVEMFVAKHNDCQSSSILPPKVHLRQYPMITFDDREIVKIDKLDNVEYDREFYDCVHIDVQGFELDVLLGAIESLRWIDEITCEVNNAELYEGCPMIEDIDEFLFFQGFKRVAVDWLAFNWGDATYKRI
jgi:FkbM family methyltransferase